MFCLADTFLEADTSHYSFMLKGLQEVEKELNSKSISFYLLRGQPEHELLYFIQEISAGFLVTDFNPLRIVQKWENAVLIHAKAPFYEVDAHNIIPCWFASPKQEYGAYTIRPKINRLLFDFLEKIPPLKIHLYNENFNNRVDWSLIFKSFKLNSNEEEIDWVQPGETFARRTLSDFINVKLYNYNNERNNPNNDVLSNMSPYLHFGQISAQFIAIEINKSNANPNSKDSFF